MKIVRATCCGAQRRSGVLLDLSQKRLIVTRTHNMSYRNGGVSGIAVRGRLGDC